MFGHEIFTKKMSKTKWLKTRRYANGNPLSYEKLYERNINVSFDATDNISSSLSLFAANHEKTIQRKGCRRHQRKANTYSHLVSFRFSSLFLQSVADAISHSNDDGTGCEFLNSILKLSTETCRSLVAPSHFIRPLKRKNAL